MREYLQPRKRRNGIGTTALTSERRGGLDYGRGSGFSIDPSTLDSMEGVLAREIGGHDMSTGLLTNGSDQERQAERVEASASSEGRDGPGPDSLGDFDLSSVRVHADEFAGESSERMGALAYTSGSDVYFADGRYSPGTMEGRCLLAHELAHVVQQSRGSQSQPRIQRKVSTLGGEWDTKRYNNKMLSSEIIGVDIDITFSPQPPTNATTIALVQRARMTKDGNPRFTDSTAQKRSIPAGEEDEGAHIDKHADSRNPLTAADEPTDTETIAQASTEPEWGQHGWLFKDTTGAVKKQDAELIDVPEQAFSGNNSSQMFETAAMVVEGPQFGTTYGSVKWGWQRDSEGTFSKIPFSIATFGLPSPSFRKAAELWNTSKNEFGWDVFKLPANMHPITPPAGEEVKDVGDSIAAGDFATAYLILNGQGIKPMLKTLEGLRPNLPKLYMNLDQAVGLSVPRMRSAIEAVQKKLDGIPLSREFFDWMDPKQNPSMAADIAEVKAYLSSTK